MAIPDEDRLTGLCNDRPGCTLTLQRISQRYVRLVHRFQGQLGVQLTIQYPTSSLARRVFPRVDYDLLDEKLRRDHERFDT